MCDRYVARNLCGPLRRDGTIHCTNFAFTPNTASWIAANDKVSNHTDSTSTAPSTWHTETEGFRKLKTIWSLSWIGCSHSAILAVRSSSFCARACHGKWQNRDGRGNFNKRTSKGSRARAQKLLIMHCFTQSSFKRLSTLALKYSNSERAVGKISLGRIGLSRCGKWDRITNG